MSAQGDKFPMTAAPIPDGYVAAEPRWYNKLFGPVSDAYGEVIADDTGWLTATMTNGWSNAGFSGWPLVSYRRKRGLVYLRGLAAGGATAVGMLTLPVGFRPGFEMIFSCAANGGGNARVDADTSGNVLVSSYTLGGNNGFVGLNGVHFWAEL